MNMRRILVLALVLAALRAGAQTGGGPLGSYYVSAAGNDRNNGLSEARAFKSLAHAVSQAARSDTIKTVTVIGTLNDASEDGKAGEDGEYGLPHEVFSLSNGIEETGSNDPILITGLPNAPVKRRAVLSAAGTDKECVRTFGAFRFEHIEISGSGETGLFVGLESDVTLGPGSLVRDNQGGGVYVTAPIFVSYDAQPEDIPRPGSLTLDGGIIENNRGRWWGEGGGIFVIGAFTMKRGSVRNNEAVSGGDSWAMGGGIYIESNEPVIIEGGDITGNKAEMGGGLFIAGGRLTMSGGVITGNTADRDGGGLWVTKGASLTLRGGAITGNHSRSPEYQDIGQED
jgi:hypothetical protein